MFHPIRHRVIMFLHLGGLLRAWRVNRRDRHATTGIPHFARLVQSGAITMGGRHA